MLFIELQPPCEMMVNEFLPNVRGVVSHELSERGESQRRIAILLGITQARVSYYLRRRKSQFISEISIKFGASSGEVANYAKLLAEDVRRSQTDGIFTLYSIWKNLLFNGMACATHQKESGISTDCSVCMELFKPARELGELTDKDAEDLQVIHEISQAISMLESSVQFPSIMPEVSVNVAMSRSKPRSARDIAAIPGRINKIHGRAKALVLPEFGASNHMSRVLLLANSREPEFKSVINIKYDDVIGEVLEDLGVPKRYTTLTKWYRVSYPSKNSENQDPVLTRLSQVKIVQEASASAVALIDRGSEGVEPMTYLLGRRATELGQLAVRIAQSYSSHEQVRRGSSESARL